MEQEKDLSGQENLLGLSLKELAQDYGQDAVEAIHGKKDSGEWSQGCLPVLELRARVKAR